MNYTEIFKNFTDKYPLIYDCFVISGQVYHYCVQCVYADGENEKHGKFSPKVHAVCLDSGKILAHKTSGRTTSFSLRLVAGADGYILERSENKDGDFTEIARTESNLELAIKDKAPSHFKTYFYRVRSFRNVKEEVFYSDGSEVVAIKTK